MILIESFLIIMMESCIITNPTGTEYVALIDNDENLAYEPIKAEFVNSGCMYCDENGFCFIRVGIQNMLFTMIKEM